MRHNERINQFHIRFELYIKGYYTFLSNNTYHLHTYSINFKNYLGGGVLQLSIKDKYG